MFYKNRNNGLKRTMAVRGSFAITIESPDELQFSFNEALQKIENLVEEFYKKTLESGGNYCIPIRIQEVANIIPRYASELPVYAHSARTITVSADMNPFCPQSTKDWKKLFNEMAQHLAEGFGQLELYVSYSNIGVAAYEKA